MKTGMFSPWDHQNVKRERGKPPEYNCMIGLLINTVKDIENLVIILVPLIMILSRGQNGQIKG